MQRCVLAYSGGLGSTIAAHWLIQHAGYEVISLSVNLGQSGELAALGEYAIELGAGVAHVVDARRRFLADFCMPALFAQAHTRDGAPMGRQLAHEVDAEEAVKLARENRCDAVAYGGSAGTRRGEGPGRFVKALASLAPDLELILPCERLHMVDRSQFLAYAEKHAIRPWYAKFDFSEDETCWGRSVSLGSGGNFDDPPPTDVFRITTDPKAAPDEPRTVEVGFENGVPVLLDGIRLDLLQVVTTLNEIGGRYGVGRLDAVEHNASGNRFREVHECPAATIIQSAWRALAEITLSHEHLNVSAQLGGVYSLLILRGFWRKSVRRSLDAYFDHARRHITGTVRCELFKGNCTITGRTAG